MVKLDRCVGSCNTLNYLSNKVCVPNKTEGLNIHIFKMITGKMNHVNVNINLMEENVIQIKSGIMKKGWSEFKKTSYIWTRFYLESCYMHLCKWKIFSKYYWRFCEHVR